MPNWSRTRAWAVSPMRNERSVSRGGKLPRGRRVYIYKGLCNVIVNKQYFYICESPKVQLEDLIIHRERTNIGSVLIARSNVPKLCDALECSVHDQRCSWIRKYIGVTRLFTLQLAAEMTRSKRSSYCTPSSLIDSLVRSLVPKLFSDSLQEPVHMLALQEVFTSCLCVQSTCQILSARASAFITLWFAPARSFDIFCLNSSLF